jgi:hypothetical protein
MSREGWPSAINTYDDQKLTWGAGFAGEALRRLWEALDDSVKSALRQRAPNRITSAGIAVDDGIRRDETTLAALVEVSESPEHFPRVFEAMLWTFLVHTVGLGRPPGGGGASPTRNPDYLYLSTRLKHARAALWDVARDTPRALERARTAAGRDPEPTDYLAACLRIQYENFLYHPVQRHWQAEGPGGRRMQVALFGEMTKWRTRRIKQWNLGQAGHDRHAIVISKRSRALCPALTTASEPYLHAVRTIEEIPANHVVGVEDPTDPPPPRRTPEERRRWDGWRERFLQSPRAGKFYDLGPRL